MTRVRVILLFVFKLNQAINLRQILLNDCCIGKFCIKRTIEIIQKVSIQFLGGIVSEIDVMYVSKEDV